jgi:hypothetical protein
MKDKIVGVTGPFPHDGIRDSKLTLRGPAGSDTTMRESMRNDSMCAFLPNVDSGSGRLFLWVLVAALFAKGASALPGFSSDDYAFLFGRSTNELSTAVSQGRYVGALIWWSFEAAGIGMHDSYFPIALVALVLQSAFVVSVLRFAKFDDLPAAPLVGALIVTHPYAAEIFTFRAALPGQCAAWIFSILALEYAARRPRAWKSFGITALACYLMLLTYQVMLNYLAVSAVFALLASMVLRDRGDPGAAIPSALRQRATTLTAAVTIAIAGFMATVSVVGRTGMSEWSSRGTLLSLHDVGQRIDETTSLLFTMFLGGERILPEVFKILILLMILISSIVISGRPRPPRGGPGIAMEAGMTVLAVPLLLAASIGVILMLNDWWPVPRVLAHVSLVIGLIFLLSDACMTESVGRAVRMAITAARVALLFSFVLLCNQILADQQRLNRWDAMFANRIVARLESLPTIEKVKYAHVEGGSPNYPLRLRTTEGDINVSAFHPPWAKVSVLSEASGYVFAKASGERETTGKAYCNAHKPWPDKEAVAIDEDLAIVCLPR